MRDLSLFVTVNFNMVAGASDGKVRGRLKSVR